MARSDTRRRIWPLALAATVAGAGAAYLAERRAVARWSAGDDHYRGELLTLTGEERWIDAGDGLRIRLVDSGNRNGADPRDADPESASTVILAHGFTSIAEHWSPVATRLRARGLRVIAYDQRGHGRSDPGDGRFRPSDLGNDLAAVIRDTAPTGAVVAGHSMGGIGIQAMLADHEDVRADLRAAVLVATAARPVGAPLATLMGRLGGTSLARRTMASRTHGRVFARGGMGVDSANVVLDVVRSGWANSSDSTRAGVMRDLRAFDLSPALPEIQLPITVIAGDADQVTPHEENRRIAELLPNGRLETLPGVGHYVPWEAADVVTEIIAGYATGARHAGSHAATPPVSRGEDHS